MVPSIAHGIVYRACVAYSFSPNSVVAAPHTKVTLRSTYPKIGATVQPHSRFGGQNCLKLELICTQNESALLKGMNRVTSLPCIPSNQNHENYRSGRVSYQVRTLGWLMGGTSRLLKFLVRRVSLSRTQGKRQTAGHPSLCFCSVPWYCQVFFGKVLLFWPLLIATRSQGDQENRLFPAFNDTGFLRRATLCASLAYASLSVKSVAVAAPTVFPEALCTLFQDGHVCWSS